MSHVMQHLAGRVWIYPHDPDPAHVQPLLGVVADERGSVLVDAGNGPGHARLVQRAIASAGLPPPRWLVYTHHHWDHVWGACAWPDVEIVGHASARPILVAEAERPWSTAYLHEQVTANPLLEPSFRARERAMPDWEGFSVVPPHTTFEAEVTLPSEVVIRHVGGRHAEDSTVIEVPDSGVLFLGDSIYPPPYHLREPGDGLDLDLARSLVREDLEWYVDSHSEPQPRSAVTAL